MFLRNAHVEELPRHLSGEVGETRTARHGAGDADDGGIGLGKAHEGLAEDLSIIGRSAGCGLPAFAGLGVVRARTVEFLRRIDRGVEALALLGQDVDEDGNVAVFRELQVFHQRVEIVPVDGSEVAQAKFLEQ